MPMRLDLCLSDRLRSFRPLSLRASARLPRQRQLQLKPGKHPSRNTASAFRTAVAPFVAPVVGATQRSTATVYIPSGRSTLISEVSFLLTFDLLRLPRHLAHGLSEARSRYFGKGGLLVSIPRSPVD